jgi:hypothetical protein
MPESIPPSRKRVSDRDRAGRIEDYRELRSWGFSRADAARRLNVTPRTIERYEAALRTAERRAA